MQPEPDQQRHVGVDQPDPERTHARDGDARGRRQARKRRRRGQHGPQQEHGHQQQHGGGADDRRPPRADALRAGREGELGARDQADQGSCRHHQEREQEGHGPQEHPSHGARRLDRAASRSRQTREPDTDRRQQQGKGEQSERPSRHQVSRQPDVRVGAVLGRLSGGVHSEHQGQGGAPHPADRVRVQGLRGVVAGGGRQLTGGGQPHGVQSLVDQRALLSQRRGDRKAAQLRQGPLVPVGQVHLARDHASGRLHQAGAGAARPGGPRDHEGRGGIVRRGLAQDDDRVQQPGIGVVGGEAAGAERSDRGPVGGDEDERLLVGRPGEPGRDLEHHGVGGDRGGRAAALDHIAARQHRDLALAGAGQLRDQVAQVHVLAVV